MDERKPRPGPSIYEDWHFDTPDDEDDRDEWVKLAETDPVTGHTRWYGNYRAFNQTPLSEWEPRRR
jgi:hypothetical protein